MNYLLDTNICIYLFKGLYNLDKTIKSVGFENCAISEITVAELYFGAEKSTNPNSNKQLINTFVEKIAIIPIFEGIEIYAKEKARLKTKGTIISDLDLFIGATAIAHNMVLVTRNTKEFIRMENIVIQNWVDIE